MPSASTAKPNATQDAELVEYNRMLADRATRR
jgi:hypothetical protein